MPEGDKKENNVFLYLLLGLCLVAIAVSFYFFYFKKDYEFIVEVACDPTKETCIQRDCTNPDDCPPNGLSDFKRYSLNAGDFEMCENEDCTNACESGAIKCEPIQCAEDELAGESCSTLESPEEVEVPTTNE
jgi:hypothetical protein